MGKEVISVTPSFLLLWILFLVSGFELERNARGLGSIFFYRALRQGKASVVVPLTTLNPLITVALSVLFLEEELAGIKILDLVLALGAGLPLSF